MKNILILGTFLAFSVLFSCKSDKKNNGGHDHTGHSQHQIVLLPFLKNKNYFEELQKGITWKHRFCVQKDSELKFVPCDFSSTIRPHFKSLLNSNINVPFYDPDTSVHIIQYLGKMAEVETENQVEITVIPKLGSHGCNYFLAGGQDDPLEKLNFDSTKIIKKFNCRLDSFHIKNQIYIHLLAIQHDASGKAPDTITHLVNHDFPISLKDYRRLDSILSRNKYVGGGFNNSIIKPLYIHVDNNGPIDSIFPQHSVVLSKILPKNIYKKITKI